MNIYPLIMMDYLELLRSMDKKDVETIIDYFEERMDAELTHSAKDRYIK